MITNSIKYWQIGTISSSHPSCLTSLYKLSSLFRLHILILPFSRYLRYDHWSGLYCRTYFDILSSVIPSKISSPVNIQRFIIHGFYFFPVLSYFLQYPTFLFWKNKRKLMRSLCWLCICVYPNNVARQKLDVYTHTVIITQAKIFVHFNIFHQVFYCDFPHFVTVYVK
jgi:hypothetical protein